MKKNISVNTADLLVKVGLKTASQVQEPSIHCPPCPH